MRVRLHPLHPSDAHVDPIPCEETCADQFAPSACLFDAHGRLIPGHWPMAIVAEGATNAEPAHLTYTRRRTIPDLPHASLATREMHLQRVPRIFTPEYQPVAEWLARGGVDPIRLHDDDPLEKCTDLLSALRRCRSEGLYDQLERVTLRVRVRYEDSDVVFVDAGDNVLYCLPNKKRQMADAGHPSPPHTCESKRRKCAVASVATGCCSASSECSK